ncbi:MAG TPA: maltose alpha-D-glucosyltransferase, partial [Thermodesulfobacteriota bacterium]|nr:maltose alpha-D-glucosyltransferase [Thermodesulfobacteriota bacterium]
MIYELPIKSFYDRNGDGVGDFAGLREKLGYLEDLGVTALWLLPFYPSPLKDDGYDIANHFDIHPDYGTLRDFREFLKEAHRRGIRIITEMVLNHTSDQHPWFQRSRRSKPGSVFRDFYVWSDNPYKFREARIIFKDFETSNWAWDPVAGAYYWHRFYSHQPDLNYDNPQVRKTIFRVIDFWLGLGVDGLRLDAVPYLFEREGTNCENLPETYAFLKDLRAHVDSRFKNRMLLAEANQWPEYAAAYFGGGDMCHMAFHFPLMPRMFLGLRTEDRFPIVDILTQTPAIPEGCQWALFLRNHDELTLEMVTDEERDYMYRVYARDPHARINLGIRRRLAPLMENSRRRIELLNTLLFFLPGTPVLYYGDEIGMGDDYYLGDRNGVRTPMQWSPDRNAGFSTGNPQRLYMPVIIDPEYHYIAVNVENQQRNPSSLLWWMKRAIAWRKRFKAAGRGPLEFLFPENSKILAFIRRFQDETVLVAANLSRYFQIAELDLSRYAGYVPEEVSSQQKFPTIRESRYVLTLGPHGYLLLSLRNPAQSPAGGG